MGCLRCVDKLILRNEPTNVVLQMRTPIPIHMNKVKKRKLYSHLFTSIYYMSKTIQSDKNDIRLKQIIFS